MDCSRLRPKSGECGPPNSWRQPCASAVRHRKLVVDADADLRAQIERATEGGLCNARSEDSRDAAPESS